MNTSERIKKVIENQLDVVPEEIIEDAYLVDELGADSLDMIEICMTLEEEFEIEIPDDQFEKWTTVESIIEYIQARLK